MALTSETQSWLEGLQKEGALSPEAIAQLRSAAESNPATAEYLKGSVLRQADYSRRQTELQTAKSEADAALALAAQKEAEVTQFQTDLAKWKGDAEPEYKRALEDSATATGRAAAAEARLKAIAKAYGVPESELGLEAPVIKKEEPVPGFDTSKFITRENIQQVMSEGALIDASIHDLDMEYFDLTGKHLKNAAELVGKAIAGKQNLKAFVEKELDLPGLRAKAGQAAIDKQIQEGIEAGIAARLSDPNRVAAGGRGDEPRSPIFGRQTPLPTPGQLDAGDSGRGVGAAIASYNAGKYKAGH